MAILNYTIVIFLWLTLLSVNHASSLEVPLKGHDRVRRMSGCEKESVCGTVQATSRGFTVTPLCFCPDNDHCPLVWDPMDARSVQQASIQYKHCKEASSSGARSNCLPGQTAYSMRILTPFAEDGEPDYESMKISHKVHCTCPPSHQLVQSGKNEERIPFIGEITIYNMSCAPFLTCEMNQACKTLSETEHQFMENEVCKCRTGLSCPVTGNREAKTVEFGVGKLTKLFCQ